MTVEDSFRVGLRIRGDEQTDDGHRHRARYRWTAQRIKDVHGQSPVLALDWGCGTGYGTRILGKAGLAAYGFDADEAAVLYGVDRWWPMLCARPSAALPRPPWTSTPKCPDVLVCLGVIEHMKSPPLESVRGLLRDAPHVIGMVPYDEPPGRNAEHLWCNLTEESFAGVNARFWFEPCFYDWHRAVPDFPTEKPLQPLNLFFEAFR